MLYLRTSLTNYVYGTALSCWAIDLQSYVDRLQSQFCEKYKFVYAKIAIFTRRVIDFPRSFGDSFEGDFNYMKKYYLPSIKFKKKSRKKGTRDQPRFSAVVI